MLVKLKVLSGASAGKEITVPTKELVIGRGDECHLRPRSDSVSRRHCVITVEDSRVSVRDLGSRNGTVVNGETITKEHILEAGDNLRVGRLEFEVCIDHGLGGAKKPRVRDVKDAVERSLRVSIEDEDIFDWLDEGDDNDRARKLADPETRQFKLDETDRAALEKAATEQAAKAADQKGKQATNQTAGKGESSGEASDEDSEAKEKKKQPGKLPRVEAPKSADTQSAAADTLRKFFNRR